MAVQKTATPFRSRCPIQCIIPPYMTDHMVEHGDAETRRRGIELISESARIRAQRELRAMMAPMMTRSRSVGTKQRNIYTAEQGAALPGTLARREGQSPVGDLAVNEAYDGLGATYDYFKERFGRNSIDGRGMRLDATVHFRVGYNNAFWDGEQMVFGDGDGHLFHRFTIALDIIAHELSHGVIENTSNLEYQGQSGALNESFADVFGILIKQFTLGESASSSDWLIGREILTSAVSGVALRSMIHPGTAYDDPRLGRDPQPDHMSRYVETDADHGGVHINSGIINRAFALAALKIGGDAWRDAGLIWYQTLLRLTRTSNFENMADMSAQVAGELFGSGSVHRHAVSQAWDQVGIRVSRAMEGTRSAPIAAAAPADFDAIVERVAQQLGTRLVEVVAAGLREQANRDASSEVPKSTRSGSTTKTVSSKSKSAKKKRTRKRKTA